MSSKNDKRKLAAGAELIRQAELEAKASTTKRSWRDFKRIHPACSVLPCMPPGELRAFADDIEANGLKFPVETRSTDNGLYVIDGKNRLDALELLGVSLIDGKGEWKHPEYITLVVVPNAMLESSFCPRNPHP